MHAVTGQHGYAVEPDIAIHEVNPAEYDLLLIPDGPAAERLRLREEAVDVARTFIENGMKVAAIGHGSQLLIAAGAIDGRQVTLAGHSRRRAAGAVYSDAAAVVDGILLTGRGPDDLPRLRASPDGRTSAPPARQKRRAKVVALRVPWH